MENKNRNIIMCILFLIILVGLSIGGYFYTKDLLKKDNNSIKPAKKINKNDYRIDKNKDYIYFENEENISIEPEITFMDVVINLEGADIINSTLKTEMDSIRKSVVKLNNENMDSNKTLLYSESDIFSSSERNYIVYKYNKYVSLVINDLNYSCYSDLEVFNTKGYVFDTENAKLLTSKELLEQFNLNEEDIKLRLIARLDETQSIVDEQEVIKKENTISSFKNGYTLYIDKGNLYVTFVVKTNFVDYNDNIKLN